MDRETVAVLTEALEAVRQAEKLLDALDRPTLLRLAETAGAIQRLAGKHPSIMLDLRMARIRIQALLPRPDPEHDPDKTPVDPIIHRRSQTMNAAKKPPEDR